MLDYKKKTIALCIASALTVLGSFCSENYKNSLVSLKVNKGSDGQVSLTAYTREPYNAPLTVEKVENETYRIILPETSSEMSSIPKIAGFNNIESLDISTYPYTPNVNGYTVIHLKTKGNPFITTNTATFIEAGRKKELKTVKPGFDNANDYKKLKQNSYWDDLQDVENKTEVKKTEPATNKSNAIKEKQMQNTERDVTLNFPTNYDIEKESPSERLAVVIGFGIIAFLIIFIFFVSRDKMNAIVGTQSDFSVDDDEEEKKTTKSKSISKTINKIDKEYKNFNRNVAAQKKYTETVSSTVEEEENVVVDLDSLYQSITSQTEQNSDSNDDLESFLSDFNFLDDNEVKENIEKQEILYDESLYQIIIKNNNIKFTDADITKIENLVQNEVSKETIDNLSQYLSEKILNGKKSSKINVLENLLAEYTIKQNIMFSKDDVDAIKKIMSVELDSSFITDLRTSKARTKEMEEELLKKNRVVTKPKDNVVLNVKDLLPNLSEELKKQGKKPIVSDAKPEVIYFSEGYEYSTLKVDKELSDLSITDGKNNKHKPSEDLTYAIGGYDVQTLSIKEEFPDLSDVKSNAKKYNNEGKKRTKPDEKALLRSISNVTFKPIYEVDYNNEQDSQNDNNIETVKLDEESNINVNENKNTQDLNNNESEKEVENNNDKKSGKNKSSQINQSKIQTYSQDAERLLKLIEEQKENRRNKIIAKNEQNDIKETLKPEIKKSKDANTVCSINGAKYILVKEVECSKQVHCMLVKKENEHIVFGKIDENYFELKKYRDLKNESFQARYNDVDDEGYYQYIIRTSIHKFIIRNKDNQLEFVMDLC